MRPWLLVMPLLVMAVAPAGPVTADQIVQEGDLSGSGEPHYQDLVLEQFDPMGGSRVLNFVQMDLLTSIRGGYTTDGSGVAVHVYARLVADYYLPPDLLAHTEALIDMIEPNTGSPMAVSVADTDTEQVVIDQPDDMAPWIGSDTITLSVFTEFEVWDDPPDVVYFGAGGTVHYSITYDYTFDPLPIFADDFETGSASAWSSVVDQ